MALTIGPGLMAWKQSHGATPLESEAYPWPDVKISCLPILIGNAQGETVRTLVGWDVANNCILEPGPGTGVKVQPVVLTLMYDSTTASDVPANAKVVAGYVDGLYIWKSSDWARFPNAKQITISVFGATLADALDSEPGDLTPEQAAAAIQDSPASMGYGSLGTIVNIKKALLAVGNTQTLRAWTAHWTGVEHLCNAACLASLGLPADGLDGVDVMATQFASPGTGSGGHYDKSLVTPEFMQTF